MKTCSICSHPQRALIDRQLVTGQPLRDVSGRFGVSRSALGRHSAHLPHAVIAVREAEEAADAQSLLDEVRALHRRAGAILDKAEQSGKWAVALAAVRECRSTLELLGRLTGELQAGKNAPFHTPHIAKVKQRRFAKRYSPKSPATARWSA